MALIPLVTSPKSILLIGTQHRKNARHSVVLHTKTVRMRPSSQVNLWCFIWGMMRAASIFISLSQRHDGPMQISAAASKLATNT